MIYVLFWIEVLAASLLSTACAAAMLGRVQRRYLRRDLLAGAMAIPLLILGFVTLFAADSAYSERIFENSWFAPTLFTNRRPVEADLAAIFWYFATLTVSYVSGAALLAYHSRQGRSRPAPVTATWPRGLLSAIFLGLCSLSLLTYWDLSLAAHSAIMTLRLEAGAKYVDLAPARVPDYRNAALVYRQAFERLVNSVGGGAPEIYLMKVGTPEAEDFLKKHVTTIALLHRGAAMPDCYFGYPNPQGNSNRITYLDHGGLGASVDLLSLHARNEAAQQRPGTALDDVQALFQIARQTSQMPDLYAAQQAESAVTTAVNALQEVMSKVNPTPAQLSRLVFDEPFAWQRAGHLWVCGDETLGVVTRCTEIEYSIGSYVARAALPDFADEGMSRALLPFRVYFLADDAARYRRFMEKHERFAEYPAYQHPQAEMEQMDAAWKAQWERGGFTHYGRWPSGLSYFCAYADARVAEARLAVAVMAYRAAHQQDPATLDDLAPVCISDVPLDPFDGKPMKWRLGPDGPVIYAVGKKGQYDGGPQPKDALPLGFRLRPLGQGAATEPMTNTSAD